MNDQQIYFEIKQLINRAEACHEDFSLQEAKRIVKRTQFMYNLVTRLIIEANTAKELSNLASNNLTKEKFGIYVDNLLKINDYLEKFMEYQPKTKTGYYMYMKDMANFAPSLDLCEEES